MSTHKISPHRIGHPGPAQGRQLPIGRPASRRGGALGWSLVALVLVLAGGFAAWYLTRQGDTSQPMTSDVVSAGVQSFDITTIASGTINSAKPVEIRSQVEARSAIAYVIPEGTQVKAGDVLLRLNTDRVEEQQAQQALEVEQARAQLVDSENAVKNQQDLNASEQRKAQLKVDLAELALDEWRKQVEKDRTNLEQARDRANRNLERLEKKVDESERLFGAGFYSADQLELDRIDLIEAQARVKTALLDLDIFNEFQLKTDQKQRESDVTEAKAEFDRTVRSGENELASRLAALRNRQEQLRIRVERLTKLESQQRLSEITAPIDGLVVYASSLDDGANNWRGGGGNAGLQIGTEVQFNELLMVIPDTSDMQARVKVNEALSGRIRPGQQATIRVNALRGAVFTGVVDSIGVLAESGGWRDPNRRDYTVAIRLTGGEQSTSLKPSMRCDAEIQLGRVDAALAVPVQAVFNEGLVRYVHVPEGSRFVRRPVSTGRRSETLVEITAGLTDGERVLVRAPAGSEVLSRTWDAEQLKLVGLTLNERGEPISAGRGGVGGGGDRPRMEGGFPPGAQQPGSGGEARPEGSQTGGPRPDGMRRGPGTRPEGAGQTGGTQGTATPDRSGQGRDPAHGARSVAVLPASTDASNAQAEGSSAAGTGAEPSGQIEQAEQAASAEQSAGKEAAANGSDTPASTGTAPGNG